MWGPERTLVPMAEVNGAQFGKVLKNTLEEGGDSVNIRTGQRPTSGYMVSDEGSEVRVQAENMSVDKIVRHTGKHHETLYNDPEAHLGTWRDAQHTADGRMMPRPTDTVYLDVSRRYHNGFLATLGAMRENQIAFYGVKEGKSFDTPKPGLRTTRAKRRAEPHVYRDA